MARFSYIINNFTSGENDPKFRGQTNLDYYRNSCDLLINAIPTRQGGLIRRGGTQYIQRADLFADDNSSTNEWDNEKTTVATRDDLGDGRGFRFIPFIFSKDEAYVFVIGVKDTASSNSYPIKIFNVSNTDQYVSLDNSTPGGIDTLITSGVSEGNAWGLFYGVADREELAEIQYAQVNDLLFICHPNYPPAVFARGAANTFSRYFLPYILGTTVTNGTAGSSPVSVQIALGFPWRDQVTSGVTMTLSAATRGSARTLTASATTGWGGFTSAHVGSYFLIEESGQTGLVIVTAITSSTVATVSVLLAVGAVGPTATWRECAWSNARGWPRTVAVHQNRLVFGGNAAQPNTIWASQVGDFGELSGSYLINTMGATNWTNTASAATSSDPFNNTILSGSADNINWMLSDQNLSVGTEGREYICEFNIGTSSTTLDVSSQTSFGSAFVQAKKVDNALTFVDRTNISVREFVFNFNEDNYRAEDVSFKSKHLPVYSESLLVYSSTASTLRNKPKIVEFQVQNTSYAQLLWFKDRNGATFICSRDRSLGVNGWARMDFSHDIDFEDINQDLTTRVETMCAVPSYNGIGDDLFIMTRRTLNSQTVFSVERLIGTESFHSSRYPSPQSALSSDTDPLDYLGLHMDYMYVDTDGDTTLSVGTALEGETMYVWSNGEYLGEYVVDGSGEITIEDNGLFVGQQIVYGLKNNFVVQPVQLEGGSVFGNAQGVIKRIEEVVLRLNHTLDLQIGYLRQQGTLTKSTAGTPYDSKVDFDYSTVTLDQLNLRPGDLPLNLQVPFFNGDYYYRFDGSYDGSSRLVLFSNSLYPIFISALIYKGTTYDR